MHDEETDTPPAAEPVEAGTQDGGSTPPEAPQVTEVTEDGAQVVEKVEDLNEPAEVKVGQQDTNETD